MPLVARSKLLFTVPSECGCAVLMGTTYWNNNGLALKALELPGLFLRNARLKEL